MSNTEICHLKNTIVRFTEAPMGRAVASEVYESEKAAGTRLEHAATAGLIHQAARIRENGNPVSNVFRAPHHSVSPKGMLGAPATLSRPFGDMGEIHLAYGGTLYLEDVGSFRLEVLREIAAALRSGTWNGTPCCPRVLVLHWVPCKPGDSKALRCFKSEREAKIRAIFGKVWHGLIEVPWGDRVDTYDDDKHAAKCHFCGRGLTEKAAGRAVWVEMTTSNMLIPRGHPDSDTHESQGCYQVGQSCARKVPKAYRLSLH